MNVLLFAAAAVATNVAAQVETPVAQTEEAALLPANPATVALYSRRIARFADAIWGSSTILSSKLVGCNR